ncbi:hypothetical protein [Paraburkholderia tropica]|uniref:hypothetical protein n=1 Tax=Paraburkholderia tropica TaxID=92647 RepID=UPI0015922A81|nr:hypothetical protein [Paraburkholderia tropica]
MSWAVLDDIEKFLTDLVLGDFQEEQRVSVQVVSGVIQLVPILGQVMGARDWSCPCNSGHADTVRLMTPQRV